MMPNVIRLSADIIHLGSIVLLLLKIRASKSCAGDDRGRGWERVRLGAALRGGCQGLWFV